jgi:hypothetical protein
VLSNFPSVLDLDLECLFVESSAVQTEISS